MGADGMTTRCEVSAARHGLTPGPSPRETRPVAAPSQGRPSSGSGGTGACPKAPVTRAGHRSSATGATGAVLGRKSLEQLSGGVSSLVSLSGCLSFTESVSSFAFSRGPGRARASGAPPGRPPGRPAGSALRPWPRQPPSHLRIRNARLQQGAACSASSFEGQA